MLRKASNDCVLFCREYLGKQLQSTEESTPAVAARSWTLSELVFASVDVVWVSVIASLWGNKSLFWRTVFVLMRKPRPKIIELAEHD